MSFNYKQKEVTATTYHRFSRVIVENPLNGFITLNCLEQSVAQDADGNTKTSDVGNLYFTFDPAMEYDLLDPTTGEPTGEKFHAAQIQQMMFSVIMAEAIKRDQALEQAKHPAQTEQPAV